MFVWKDQKYMIKKAEVGLFIKNNDKSLLREPWSSDYGRSLLSKSVIRWYLCAECSTYFLHLFFVPKIDVWKDRKQK